MKKIAEKLEISFQVFERFLEEYAINLDEQTAEKKQSVETIIAKTLEIKNEFLKINNKDNENTNK